jgi:hypothetical protein
MAACQAHTLEVEGSNPSRATNFHDGGAWNVQRMEREVSIR